MDVNEIIENEEVIEVTEGAVNVCSTKGVKATAGIRIAAIVGVIAYKFVVKPMVAKLKAKKDEREEEQLKERIDTGDDQEEQSKEETENKEND